MLERLPDLDNAFMKNNFSKHFHQINTILETQNTHGYWYRDFFLFCSLFCCRIFLIKRASVGFFFVSFFYRGSLVPILFLFFTFVYFQDEWFSLSALFLLLMNYSRFQLLLCDWSFFLIFILLIFWHHIFHAPNFVYKEFHYAFSLCLHRNTLCNLTINDKCKHWTLKHPVIQMERIHNDLISKTKRNGKLMKNCVIHQRINEWICIYLFFFLPTERNFIIKFHSFQLCLHIVVIGDNGNGNGNSYGKRNLMQLSDRHTILLAIFKWYSNCNVFWVFFLFLFLWTMWKWPINTFYKIQ